MRLTPNFLLSEFEKSQTALRQGIDNSVPEELRGNLVALCENVLEPVRAHFCRPITINSGFRCLELNRAVGSSDNSQHRHGEAADIEIPGIPNIVVAKFIAESLPFDQCILEFYNPDDPAGGWVHCSHKWSRWNRQNRKQTLTIGRGPDGKVRTTPGFPE